MFLRTRCSRSYSEQAAVVLDWPENCHLPTNHQSPRRTVGIPFSLLTLPALARACSEKSKPTSMLNCGHIRVVLEYKYSIRLMFCSIVTLCRRSCTTTHDSRMVTRRSGPRPNFSVWRTLGSSSAAELGQGQCHPFEPPSLPPSLRPSVPASLLPSRTTSFSGSIVSSNPELVVCDSSVRVPSTLGYFFQT